MMKSLLWRASLAGFLLVSAGLYIGSSHFLDFAAAHISSDGVLDTYTLEQAADFSFKIICAGLLFPIISFLAPPALSYRPAGRRGAALAGVALVILAALYLWLVNVPPYYAANLRTLHDEVQYAIPAINLLAKGRLVMVMNGVEYPPVSPFGFHIILMPFYRIFGTTVGNGIRAVQASSLLALLLTFTIASMSVGRKRALLATVLLAANPIFIYQSGKIMATIPRLAFFLAALLLLLLAWRSNRRGALLFLSALLGFISGFMLLIHLSSIVLIAFILISLIYVLAKKRMGIIAPVLIYILLVSFTFLPLLLYQSSAYGSWFTTGYQAWIWSRPFGEDTLPVFSLSPTRYGVAILDGLSKMGIDPRVSRLTGRLLDLIGLGKLYNVSVFMLMLLGIACIRKKSITTEYEIILIFLALFITIGFFIFGLYSLHLPRFLLPVFPCVCIVCADAFCSCFLAAGGRAGTAKRMALCILLAFSLSGMFALVRKKFVSGHPFPSRYEMVHAYQGIIDGNAVIISGIDGAYMGHFLADGKDAIWYPVSARVNLARQGKKLLFPVASENIPLIREYLDRKVPVYIDDLREFSYAEDFNKLREAFLFEHVRSVNSYSIYRLSEREVAAQ